MSKNYQLIGTIAETSPAAASTVASTATVSGLSDFSHIAVEADLVGATGGTLDVYLQRKLANNLWRDWVHFAQLGAGAAAVKLTVPPAEQIGTPDIVTVGGGTDDTPGVALAADTAVGGHPGNEVRAVYVAGASTSAGAALTIRFLGLR